MAGFDYVKPVVDQKLGLATLYLNRPDKRNALNADLVRVLNEELRRMENSVSIRMVFLRGNGPAFCAGADLAEIQAMQNATYDQNLKSSEALRELFTRLATFPKPTAAIVHGAALAGGCGLATCCDFVIAGDQASFGYPEVRIGFIPALVMVLLTHQIGERATRDLCISGRTLDAHEAMRIGLVTKVVSPDKLDDTAMELAKGLAQNSSQAMASVKAAFWKIHEMGVEEALKKAAELNAKARESDDCKEGIAAFLEKRKPRWQK
ncbi:MAG: enoyl-CoA hydratase/isomerase family protein [Planctomycetes bacterium]|nr:enoyl-CoA hydratase/isomerase family protein [Planctomycetota bacterium]